MKNLLILTLFVWSSLAFPVCSSQISRTNSSALSVLTATKYNTDLNTVYSRVNELPGDCIESESVTTTQIDDGTIVNADISASAGIARSKLGTPNYVIASSNSASYSNATALYTDVTNQSVSITTTGNPVEITILEGDVQITSASVNGCIAYAKAVRSGTDLTAFGFGSFTGSASCNHTIAPGSLRWLDFPAAGTYTYKIQAKQGISNATVLFTNVKIIAREL